MPQTEHKDKTVIFDALSIANQYGSTFSHTGQVADYSGYSLTGGFALRRQLSPTAGVGEIRETLATLITDLFKPR